MMSKTPFILAGLSAWFGNLCLAGGPPGALTGLFPPSVVEVQPDRRGSISSTTDYHPSGSSWAEGLDERTVFFLEMTHQQDPENSYELRIGQGGQIYSLRGAFGESVPPSWRDGSHRSPWNDEVWQFVTACERYNGLNSLLQAGPVPKEVQDQLRREVPYRKYFVHNSGCYAFPGAAIENLYCPLLASWSSPDGRVQQTLNWGLVSVMHSIHRSPLLYYCQTRDVGDGIIELTWVVHNFSLRDDIEFRFMNAPWGGTRVTSLPYHYVATPDGQAAPRQVVMGPDRLDPQPVTLRKTGGWNLSCATEAEDSPSLALVFGRDRHLEVERSRAKEGKPYVQFKPSLYRNWRASYPLYEEGKQWADWKTRPENSFRNYDVVEVIPKFILSPGRSIWYRSFLVVNSKQAAIDHANALVPHVDYGLLQFEAEATPLVPVELEEQPAFSLYAYPVPGSVPIFRIRNATTGQEVLSTDPYMFVKTEILSLGVPAEHPHHDYYKDARLYCMDEHNSEWVGLAGYALKEKPAGAEFRRLSELLPPTFFPPSSDFHVDAWGKVGD